MNTQVNTLCCRHLKESDGDRLAKLSQTDLWVSKYIKWKLFCDLVLCQVSRDKEDEEGERRSGKEVEKKQEKWDQWIESERERV